MKKEKILLKVHTDFVNNLVIAIKEEKSIKHFILFKSWGKKWY